MRLTLLSIALAGVALPAAADTMVGTRYTGDIVSRDGQNIGSVSLFPTASGLVRVNVAAIELPAGGHGLHLHEVGVCEGDFSSAGEHIAGDRQHGLVEGGPHPGDLPNGFVEEDGALNYETLNAFLDVDAHLGDADGAAFIIHSDPDDYETQPSGEAGDRIACAVLEPASD